MKKYLIDCDGDKHLLADLTEQEFEMSNLFVEGTSDTEYKVYLRRKGMSNIDDFNDETLKGAKVIVIE